MLKYGEINPLNVMGLRELSHCPPHFTKVFFNCRVPDKRIKDWVYSNLQSRFWLGDLYRKENGKAEIFKCVAFEEPSESTIFLLNLDIINSYGKNF